MARAPEVVFIAITFADGTLGIMQFVTEEFNADGTVRWSRFATPGAIDQEIARSSWDVGKTPIQGWRPLDRNEIPKDRTYRNALRDQGGKLGHDLDAVKAIAVGRIRERRDVELAALDGPWMKATAQGDAVAAAAVEAQRQALRDKPQEFLIAVEGAKSVDDIHAIAMAVKP